jgi:hypothetical protein
MRLAQNLVTILNILVYAFRPPIRPAVYHILNDLSTTPTSPQDSKGETITPSLCVVHLGSSPLLPSCSIPANAQLLVEDCDNCHHPTNQTPPPPSSISSNLLLVVRWSCSYHVLFPERGGWAHVTLHTTVHTNVPRARKKRDVEFYEHNEV